MGSSIGVLLYLALVVVEIASMWIMFQKAGQPGWASIIPIYNAIVLLRIVRRSPWWILGLIVPILNLVVWVLVAFDLARVFGKGTGFGFGILFLSPIFIPILAFGDARYNGSGGVRVSPAI